MKKAILILTLLALAVSCGWSGRKKQVADTETAPCTVEDTITETAPYTVEDTVRLRLGGKLYALDIAPSDSITVIGTNHGRPEDGEQYREYRFVVHDRHSRAHYRFEASTLDSIYNSYRADSDYVRLYEEYLKPELDSVRAGYIDPAIGDFNGYWVYLTEYEGDYYLDDNWAWHRSFHIADSVFTRHEMDGPFPSKLRKAVVSDGTLYLDDEEGNSGQFEQIDAKREIYGYGDGFVTPARAIHNFEMIQYTNSTGDLID
jgi:hypothetical protein